MPISLVHETSYEGPQEFWHSCRTSQNDIVARIPQAGAAAEPSRNSVAGSVPTREEKTLEELLGANEAILKALEMYDIIASGKNDTGLVCRSTMRCARVSHLRFRAGPSPTPPLNNVGETITTDVY